MRDGYQSTSSLSTLASMSDEASEDEMSLVSASEFIVAAKKTTKKTADET